MAFNAVVGNLSILLGLEAGNLPAEVGRVGRQLKSLDGTTLGLISTMSRAAGIMAGAATGAAIALAASSSKLIDEQSKLSRQLAGSVEGLQTLTRSADLAGISSEELTKAAERLNRRLGTASRESLSEANDALKRLGLTASQLSRVDVDERFALIADAAKNAGLNSQQLADTLGQLGIRSGKIFNLLEDGGDAIRQARNDVRLFGVAVSDIDAKSVERSNDALTVFQLAARGAANQVAIALAPSLEAAANSFRRMVEASGGMENIVLPIVESLVRQFSGLAARIQTTRQEWTGLVYLFTASQAIIASTQAKILEFGDQDSFQRQKQYADELWSSAEKLNEEFKQLRDNPPDPEAWIEAFRRMNAEAKISSITLQAIRDRMGFERPPPANVDEFSGREKKALSDKLDNFKKTIATEGEAQKIEYDNRLKQLDEFNKAGLLSTQQYAAMKNQIEAKFSQERRDSIFQNFTQDTMTELELMDYRHQEQLRKLQEFEDARAVTSEQAERYRYGIEQKYARDRLVLQSQTYSSMASIVDTSMSAISQVIGDESEKGFTIFKAISMATALVKGYEAAVSAWATGEKTGIPGMGAIMAGIAAAGTAAIIAKLAGVGPKSGGGGGGVGGVSAGASAESAMGGSGSSQVGASRTLYIGGMSPNQMYSDQTVRHLIERINEWQGDDGNNLVIMR